MRVFNCYLFGITFAGCGLVLLQSRLVGMVFTSPKDIDESSVWNFPNAQEFKWNESSKFQRVFTPSLSTMNVPWPSSPMQMCRDVHRWSSEPLVACSIDFQPEIGNMSEYTMYWPLVRKQECTNPSGNIVPPASGGAPQFVDHFPHIFDNQDACLNPSRNSFKLGDKLLGLQHTENQQNFPFMPKLVYGRGVVVWGASFLSPAQIWTASDMPWHDAFTDDALAWRSKVQNVSGLVSYDVVISIVRAWGDATTHWHADTMPRLVALLPELIKNHWHLYLVFDTESRKPFVRRWLTFWGAEKVSLIVATEPVFAREAFRLSSDATDGSLLGASLPLLRIQRERALARAAFLRPELFDSPPPPYVLCVVRTSGAKRENDRSDEVKMNEIRFALENRGLNVQLMRDDNATLMECLACQISLFHHASFVVGFQGAALVFALYMQPGRTLCQVQDDVPYFQSLAMVVGIRHFAVDNVPLEQFVDHVALELDPK